MNENLKKFFDQLSTDSTLREKFVKQPSLEAAYAFAAEAVPGLTWEEFTAALENLRQTVGRKLTDEELEKVGGGATGWGQRLHVIREIDGKDTRFANIL